MPIGTFVTMGVQIGVTLINQHYNKKNLEKIKEMQQKAKSAAQKRLLERDFEKFQKSCEYQYQIEEEAHAERLKLLEQDFITSFEKMAHNANLATHYPLNISPYIISRSVIPIKGVQLHHLRQEFFCVLTNSNDKIFNKEVIPYIDSSLCNLIAAYWNKDSLHTMCYFSNTWKESIVFCDEDIENLKSTIATPTITITPYLEKKEKGIFSFVIKLNIWGIGSENTYILPTKIQFDTIPIKYSTQQIDEIVNEIVSPIICATAQVLDVYYWETSHLSPLLPSLIYEGKIILDEKAKQPIKESYVAMYQTLVLGIKNNIINDNFEQDLISDVAMINQCNYPTNNIKFLHDLSQFIDSPEEAETLIMNSFIYLYESRTGNNYESISSIKISQLDKNDIDLIRELIQIANQKQNHLLSKDLISIIKNKINYWNIELTHKIMQNKEKITPEEKINVAIENFKILKENTDNFSVREQLEMASSIRDHLSSDEMVINACLENVKLSEKRKHFLDDIRNFQLDLISQNTKKIKAVSLSKCSVNNFRKAKTELLNMVENELAIKMFNDAETQSIFANIEECRKHISTLNNVLNNFKYSKYKILIMGDFQSGKSTTFDAFCDGRRVCAIGKGVATSAVLVTATYSEKEHIKIYWRTKEQFACIFKAIAQFLPNYNFDTFDLDKDEERSKLARAIEALRISKQCPKMSDENAKFLMLCDFVLRYYDTEELIKEKGKQKDFTNPAEITMFPENGETLWKKSGITAFNIEEVLFVFIERVDCFIKSETLRELNCTIIDSPGLFNSSYDTMITEQAMVEAHAIIYVLPYAKAMSQDVCMSLYKIKENYPDIHRKLFIVNNTQPGRKKVFQFNCENIKDMFGMEQKTYRYDAKLAYLLQLKKLYDSSMAYEKDYKDLLSETEESYDEDPEIAFDTFEEAWESNIGKYSNALKKEIANILQGKVEEGLKASGFIELTIALRNFIESNEAYAMIVSNGLAPMVNEIEDIKSSLYRSYIEPLFSTQENMKKLWEDRIQKAEEFQKYTSRTLNKDFFEGNDSLLTRMAENEYKKLFTAEFYKDLSYEIAGVIYDNKKTLLNIKSLFKKGEFETQLIAKLSPLIQNKIQEIISNKIAYLNFLIKKKQNDTLTNIFIPCVERIASDFLLQWNKKYGDNNLKMQDYLVLSKDLISNSISESDFQSNNTIGLSDNKEKSILVKGYVSEICTIVASIATMIASYIAMVFMDPTGVTESIALAIGGVFGLTLGFVGLIAPDWARDKSVKKIGNLLLPKIETKENAKHFKSLVQNQFKIILTKYINTQKVNIQKMKNERDLALHPSTDRESLCFRSIAAMTFLNKQLEIYEKYENDNLIYETT